MFFCAFCEIFKNIFFCRTSLVVSRSFFKNSFFYRTPLWSFQQNNVIFSVITITLGYNEKLSQKYPLLFYQHPSLYKNIHLLSKYSHPVQKLYNLSNQSSNFMTLSSIYNFNILMFVRRYGVSHSNAVHLIVCLSKIDCPIYQEEELTSV